MNFVALDVETTGTLAYMDHIVELAAVRFSAGKKQESFSTLVDPGVPIPESASQVNGITDEMLKGKPVLSSVLNSFSEFCGSDILVAHNAIFDFQFISQALEKCRAPSPSGLLFDTYALSKKVFPGLSNYKLSTLVEHLKIPVSHFHRAEQDAYACGELFNLILQKINRARENGVYQRDLINPSNITKNQALLDLKKITQMAGKKVLKFPAPKAFQLSLFDETL